MKTAFAHAYIILAFKASGTTSVTKSFQQVESHLAVLTPHPPQARSMRPWQGEKELFAVIRNNIKGLKL